MSASSIVDQPVKEEGANCDFLLTDGVAVGSDGRLAVGVACNYKYN